MKLRVVILLMLMVGWMIGLTIALGIHVNDDRQVWEAQAEFEELFDDKKREYDIRLVILESKVFRPQNPDISQWEMIHVDNPNIMATMITQGWIVDHHHGPSGTAIMRR